MVAPLEGALAEKSFGCEEPSTRRPRQLSIFAGSEPASHSTNVLGVV